jgi:prepilin-type processing-associated H-X9-DG protein
LVDANRVLPVSGCASGSGTADGASGRFLGTATAYIGSYGDGFNNIPDPAIDPYGGDGARLRYGCGGCASNNRLIATTACPQPGSGYGGGPNHRGFFDYLGQAGPVRISTVTDGLSNTIMIGHTTWIGSSTSNIWMTSTGSVNGTSIPINWVLKRCLGTAGMSVDSCNFTASTWMGRGFASLHSGGVPVAFGDGSVHFIREGINPFTYNALGSRAGGEVTPSDY